MNMQLFYGLLSESSPRLIIHLWHKCVAQLATGHSSMLFLFEFVLATMQVKYQPNQLSVLQHLLVTVVCFFDFIHMSLNGIHLCTWRANGTTLLVLVFNCHKLESVQQTVYRYAVCSVYSKHATVYHINRAT